MNEYDIIALYDQMEKELIKSMKRNLGRHKAEEKRVGFKFEQWQKEKLKSLHQYRGQNRTIMKAYTKGLNKAVVRLMNDQYKDGKLESFLEYKRALKDGYETNASINASDAFFKTNSRKANTFIKTINNDLKKANNACLRRTNDIYREVIHKAGMFVSNGVYTEKQAIDMAIKEFAQKGVNCIVYKNGAKHTISDYASMAIRTASQRAQLMAEGEFRKKIGETLVVASKHGTACEICQQFEGKVFIDDVYSGGTKDDGNYPLLSEAMEQGMFHPNCRHGLNTYYEGITKLSDKKVDDTDVGDIKETNKDFVEATTIKEATKYAKDNLGMGIVEYDGLDVKVANELNKTLTYYKNNYPEILENMNCVGNYQTINKLRKDTMFYQYLKEIREKYPTLGDYRTRETAKKWANRYIGKINSDTWAVSVSNPSYDVLNQYKGVYISKIWGSSYDKFIETIKKNIEQKFHPIGTDSVKAVVDHEIGHQLDTLLGIGKETNIQELYNKRTKEQLTEELSVYSWSNRNRNRYSEMIAEGWSEYLNNPNPRPIAKEIGETIERKYAEWKRKSSSKK